MKKPEEAVDVVCGSARATVERRVLEQIAKEAGEAAIAQYLGQVAERVRAADLRARELAATAQVSADKAYSLAAQQTAENLAQPVFQAGVEEGRRQARGNGRRRTTLVRDEAGQLVGSETVES